MASPKADAPAQIPSAIGSRAFGKAATMIDSERGPIRAPPTPWTARLATSSASVCERAQAAELTVKIASPRRNSRRLPNRSPSLPPRSVSEARASENALTVHSRDCSLALRLRPIEGSATVMTVMSSITMNSAKTIAPRISHCRSERFMAGAFLGRGA